jgi:hypothetical protein
VLWGTDSIWYGTPQWQIEAFRRFEIPPALVGDPEGLPEPDEDGLSRRGRKPQPSLVRMG